MDRVLIEAIDEHYGWQRWRVTVDADEPRKFGDLHVVVSYLMAYPVSIAIEHFGEKCP